MRSAAADLTAPAGPPLKSDDFQRKDFWRATVLTLFPEMFPGPLGVSLAGKALASGLVARRHATSGTRPLTDTAASTTPRRGGPGMVLRADPCWRQPSTPADIVPDRPRLLMSRGSAIDPVPGHGTRRRAGR